MISLYILLIPPRITNHLLGRSFKFKQVMLEYVGISGFIGQ